MQPEYDTIRIDRGDGTESIEENDDRVEKIIKQSSDPSWWRRQFIEGGRISGEFAYYERRLKGMPLYKGK
jgi:hypothetical protein